jgi:hypothetical protein
VEPCAGDPLAVDYNISTMHRAAGDEEMNSSNRFNDMREGERLTMATGRLLRLASSIHGCDLLSLPTNEWQCTTTVKWSSAIMVIYRMESSDNRCSGLVRRIRDNKSRALADIDDGTVYLQSIILC